MRRGAWLGLLALACLQLTLAGHQFAHAAETVDKSCRVCVQLDRLDDVAADHQAAATEPGSTFCESAGHDDVVGSQIAVRGYDSRAPPLL